MKRLTNFLMNNFVILAIIILMVILSLVSPHYFSYSTLTSLLLQISVYGMVSCAMTISLIGGEFDLSIGMTLPLSTLLFATYISKMPVLVSVVLVLIIGTLIGMLNGFLVGFLKLNAFIVTLAIEIALKGVTLMYCNGSPIAAVNEHTERFANGGVAGFSWMVFVYFGILVLTAIFLKKTSFGRNIYATGSNYDAAKAAGIPVRIVKFTLFVILGFTSSLAGIFMACRLQAGSPLYGNDVCMYTVSACVLGGVSLSGGKGSVWGTFFGMLFMGILNQMFAYLNVYTYLQQLIQGMIIILVVLTDAIPRDKLSLKTNDRPKAQAK